nr:MAG TPA: hypothetical protein [Caudoviricetes sp.]
MFDTTLGCVVSIGAFVFGGAPGFRVVCDRGFSCLGGPASRVRGFMCGLGCWCGVGCVCWLRGLLGV